LRVYRDLELVARCPGDRACRTAADGAFELDLVAAAAGLYRVVSLTSSTDVPPPAARGLDGDLLTARNAGAEVTVGDPLRVQP
ncbi:MAG TPA: hypothetical protein VHE35_24295, partial [Kofleriaceae bacterium]|nr:hypothetical protein [Kofleriaceae bacterium]